MRFLLPLLATTILFGYAAPWDNEKFRPVLTKSKLQAPKSKYNPKYGTRYGMFQGVAHKYFYLKDKTLLTFTMCGKKHRSELREANDWQVEDTNAHILFATVKLDPFTTQREFTFLQIHADPNKKIPHNISTNKPLLRVVWKKHYRHRYNHLWAVICTNTNPKHPTYTKIDLGERKEGFQKFKVIVQNSTMQIYVDDKLLVDFDVSYWNGMWNYFKAGVYLQSEGCAKAYFQELSFE